MTVFEIVIIVILGVALIVFLVWRNARDLDDTNPDLTKALKDAEKKAKQNKAGK